MLRILIKLLSGVWMLIALSGCYRNKENTQLTGVEKHRYSGMIYEHYEEGRTDPQTGTHTEIAWDSAYTGQGFIMIDHSGKIVKFSVGGSDTITEPLYSSIFNFVPGATVYDESLSHGYSENYEINSPDSLVYANHVSPAGNNFSFHFKRNIDFRGRKVY